MSKVLVGGMILLVMILTAVAAPLLSPYDPLAMSLVDRLEAPSPAHPLGRDENGADVLSQLIYGARVSLSVALIVVVVSGSIGLLIGSLGGYRGGWVDGVLMRTADMFHAFPGFLIALALVAMLGPSLRNLIFALCFTSWTGFARLVRGEVLHLKEREHVQAACAIGAGPFRIMVTHIWPNLFGLVAIQCSFAMAGTVIAESGLSFLGLGVPPSTPTWGSLLSAGRRVISEAPHVSLAPGTAILILVLAFNLLADGLRDVLDPRRVK